MQQIILIKSFQMCRIVCVVFCLSYYLGTLWFVMSLHTSESEDEYTFYNEYDLAVRTSTQNVVSVVYFMFTTLTTVGLGDYNPKSEIERLFMCLILLLGVTCFSYLLSVLTSIVDDV